MEKNSEAPLASSHPLFKRYENLMKKMAAANKKGDFAMADHLDPQVSELAIQIAKDLHLEGYDNPNLTATPPIPPTKSPGLQ